MRHPPRKDNSRERELKQVDLLDLVESLEKKRRRLLVSLVKDFGAWGELINEIKRLIEEMKRKKFLQDTHEIED